MPLDSLPSDSEPERPRGGRACWADFVGRWWPGLGNLIRPKPVHQTAAFSAAIIALAAKMAKADGVAVKIECQTFERFFEPAPHEIPRIRQLYQLASQDTAGFEHYAESIARMLKDDHDLKISVLECLLMIACADGIMHPAEEAFLRTVGHTFGITCEEFRKIKAPFLREIDDPYDVLGVNPSASAQEVRTRYIDLVQRFHPDRLIARGAQAALVKAATLKLAAINAAYEAILAGRRLQGDRA
ncbi:MAG: TerB family tellurite resistance protein [Hyphomicrobium sp.]|jgi:DnaJ like chaperone protein|uniref:TerB family tellurite resistance protein n=1 Tax=Hyphomicrobium sp. TaxID=82 RepID=UPI0025BEB89D|nr:TerB family tellurite resistance protein [Hyphomicrobium sp.]MBX9865059.1 TerB family tellurite resistance protein [Hyphomicrobium sp.]